MGRQQEIMALMNQKKDAAYPDLTPAVRLELAKTQAKCAESAAALAATMDGADEEALNSMCVRNMAMVTPILNQSYYIRKEVLGWDCRL